MLQPIAVGAWCTICLVTAVIMLLMILPAVDEIVATVQFMKESKRQGHSLWRTFWLGADFEMSAMDEMAKRRESKMQAQHPDAVHGANVLPWNLVLSAILGLWMMMAPTVFSTQDLASHSHHLVGALIVTFAVIAMAEVARPIRLINVLLGLALAVAVWFLPGGSQAFRWNATITCGFLILSSLPLGRIQNRFSNYDQVIRWAPLRKRYRTESSENSRAAS